MRIDNNYTQYRQPNFGRLKSIKYCNSNYLDLYPQETAELLRAVKESKAFNEFFKKYDVDMFIGSKIKKYEPFSAYMILKTSIPKTKDRNWYPKLKFVVLENPKENLWSPEDLFNRLTQSIKKLEFSDLKNKLDNSLKQLEDSEKDKKISAMYRAKIDAITNRLHTQDSHSPVESKEKTLFEKLFGWLK